MSYFSRAAVLRKKGEFDEDKHPRADDGKWTAGAGSTGIKDKDQSRSDLARQIDATKENYAQHLDHPAVHDALAQMKSIKPTDTYEGYGTPEFEDAREFTIDGKKVKGYKAGIKALVSKAASYSTEGPVEDGLQAYIVVGPPAAGKSALAEKLAKVEYAAIIDADDVKKTLPEYHNGVGANAVHEESSRIASGDIFKHFARTGSNMILPKVGNNPRSISKAINSLKALGYDVHLVNQKVSADNAMGRMLKRFVKTGRLIPPDYFKSIGTKPKDTYDELKGDSRVSSYAEIDNDGPIGSEKLTEGTGRAKKYLKETG